MFKRYGFVWITGGFFILSLIGHWVFAWLAYASEQTQHGQLPQLQDYLVVVLRDTLENWQSEFLQLIWQVAGLALLLHVGSPQSKEGDDRMEAKLDALLMEVAKEKAERIISEIDDAYEGRHTDTQHQQRIARRAER